MNLISLAAGDHPIQPPASPTPTRATVYDCGTWPTASRPTNGSPDAFEGHGERIDNVLVRHTLFTPLPTAEVIRQARLDQLPSITTKAAARRAQPASDHTAVLAHPQP